MKGVDAPPQTWARSLVPFWTDDLSIGNRLINARSESVAEKPWQGIETIIWDGVTGTRIMW